MPADQPGITNFGVECDPMKSCFYLCFHDIITVNKN
jgi:hypothetical protein